MASRAVTCPVGHCFVIVFLRSVVLGIYVLTFGVQNYAHLVIVSNQVGLEHWPLEGRFNVEIESSAIDEG